MCFWRPWGTVIRSQELVPKDAKWSSFHFLLQLQLPSTKKHCICPALLQETDSPPGSTFLGHGHISDTMELPRCQIWAKFCAGVGSLPPPLLGPLTVTSSHSPIQCPRLIFLKFTLESSLCFQSLEWLPKTCSMKIKPLASLYNSHSESGIP